MDITHNQYFGFAVNHQNTQVFFNPVNSKLEHLEFVNARTADTRFKSIGRDMLMSNSPVFSDSFRSKIVRGN